MPAACRPKFAADLTDDAKLPENSGDFVSDPN
jgi:hypothetical protein